jgi:hypothetical protein
MTELRSLNKNIENIYKYIVEPFEADIIICVQETSPDDSEKIKLFHKNVVYSQIYKKPDPFLYFNFKKGINIPEGSWMKSSNLQIYINYYKMSEIIKNIANNYDYFITMRTDVDILFPFPEKEFFNNIPLALYSFDTNYSKNWGGSGYSVFIHKNYIFNYLRCYYYNISNKIGINLTYNQEKFQKKCLELVGILNRQKYIKNTNLYYNSTTLNDYSTWSKPILHGKYNVFCKYPDQCNEAYNNLKLWMNGYKWKYQNGNIFLQLS